MNIELKQDHLSLRVPFQWRDIPPFAVITGLNGVGKSQLLLAIENRFQQRGFDILVVDGFVANPGEVLRRDQHHWELQSSDSSVAASVGDVDDMIHRLQQVGTVMDADRAAMMWPDLRELIEEAKSSGVPSREDLGIRLLHTRRPRMTFLGERIEQIFTHYRASLLEWKVRERDLDEFVRQFGPPPWLELNELVARIRLPYRFNDPSESFYNEPFHLRLLNTTTGDSIDLQSLSSGEKRMMAMVFWLFGVTRADTKPKLLLLDEPDSHLHPSLTRDFMTTLREVLVVEHDIRIIMTTHRATTVAYAPKGSLFEMKRNPTEVVPVADAGTIISKLTAGFSIVTRETVFVLSEDQDDATVYGNVERTLRLRGWLDGTPGLVFLPARVKKVGDGGGRPEVEKLVQLLNRERQTAFVMRGLVDRDGEKSRVPGVTTLRRCCLENYLCDPLTVYSCLLQRGVPPEVDGIEARRSLDGTFIGMASHDLQRIADVVIARMKAALATLEGDPPFDSSAYNQRQVSFCSGQTLMYPAWLFDHDGKRILKAAMKAFKGSHVNRQLLISSLERIDMVPKDLAATIDDLRQPG